MARLTQNDAEIRHLIEIVHKSPFTGILQITLKDGTVHEGVGRGGSVGNNFKSGMRGPTAYYAEETIQSLDGTMHTLDVLDMHSIVNVWEQKKQAYVDAGIITIQGW